MRHTVLDIEINRDELEELIIRILSHRENSNGQDVSIHDALQLEIGQTASQYGCEAVLEYPIKDRGDGRRGRVDIVWKAGANIVAAFEIDSILRRKSIYKLLHLPTENRFWIYYGHNSWSHLMATLDPQGQIEVISVKNSVGYRYPKKSRMDQAKTAPKYQIPSDKGQDVTTLLKSHLQRAVEIGWRILPDEHRSKEAFKQVMSRALLDEINTFEEDVPKY